MQSAYIINDRTGKPYAVVGIIPGGTEFYPIAESAVSWASWMTQDFAAKKITKEQLTVTLDNSMVVEGPMPANRTNKPKLEELIKKAKKVPKGESDKEEMEQTEEKALLPVLSLMDVRLDALEDRDWRNTINFKAKSLLSDSTKSTFAYEVKRTRAAWDPTLSIPGTDRRGGWRCPPGTRYGGQITDRFGRNCGWGVARRLANEISDLGERLENVGDRRRERRVARRNERVARRLVQGGRVERAARAVGNALETRPGRERRPGAVERAAGRLGEMLESTPDRPNRPGRQRRGENNRTGVMERAARRVAEALETDDSPKRPAPRRPRPAAPQARPARPRQPRNNRRNSAEDLFPQMDDNELLQEWCDQNNRIVNNPGPLARREAEERKRQVEEAMRARGMDIPNGNAQGAQRRPRQPQRGGDNVSMTPVPAGAPRASETLEQYKRRKYNEHQARVRKIREEGGRAGFLKYEEWEQFHGPDVEANWNKAQARKAGRGARRTAVNTGAARTATRRPPANAEPDRIQPPRRQRRPFNAPNQRGLADEAAAKRKRAAMERDNNNQYKIVKYNDRYYVVEESEVARAQAAGANLDVVNEPPRPDARPAPSAPRRPRGRGRARGGAPKASDLVDVQPPHREHKADRFDNHAMGHKVVNGVLVPDPVARGNNGINSQSDAVSFVAGGGSLDEVPDEFVHSAIFDNAAMPGEAINGKRFKLDGDPGDGINNRGQNDPRQKTYLVTDTVTGRRYIMKSPSWVEEEVVGEQYAALLGQMAGRPMARVRVIGPREQRINRERGIRRNMNNQILVEHFGDIVDGNISPGGRMPTNPDRRGRATVAFLDRVLGNPDRHPNNYLWVGDEQLPIDHGILPAGDGRIRAVNEASAMRIMQDANFAHIKQSFRRFSNSDIESIVVEQGAAWRAAGIPASLVDANVNAMRETFRNLAEAARR